MVLHGDRRLGQGRDNVKEIIKNEPELAAELEQKIKDKIAEDIEKAKEERVAKANASKPAPKPERFTREEALAKINIMVEDDGTDDFNSSKRQRNKGSSVS